MSVFAGKTSFQFEPKMPVAMDAVATTATVEPMRCTIGPIANLSYTPARFGYLVRLSSAPNTGAATLRLVASGTILHEVDLALVGATTIAAQAEVDLYGVTGAQALRVEVEVTSAADAGITAQVDGKLDIDLPLAVAGC